MKLFLAAVLFTFFHSNEGKNWVTCKDRTGFKYVPCPDHTSGGAAAPGGGGPPQKCNLLGCCKVVEYKGKGPVCYEIPPSWKIVEMVIFCSSAAHKKNHVIEIKQFHCLPGGGCKVAKLSHGAEYPIKLDIAASRFHISAGGEEFYIKFFVTNSYDESCLCPENCKSGWTSYGDYCYKTENDYRQFHPSEDHCNSLDQTGSMASIHSAEENTFVKQLFTNQTTGPKKEFFWIGLHDRELGDKDPRGWRWMDCTPFDFQAWNGPEPNDLGGNEDCGHFLAGPKWNDMICTKHYRTVCKYYRG